MVFNRKRILAAMTSAGIAVGALGGGVAIASARPDYPPATATATGPSSVRPEGGCGDISKMWAGLHPVTKAAAGYLGLSQAQLRSALQSGKSLADVARAQGKSVSGLKSAMLGAITNWINASNQLSASQKAAAISEVKGHLDALVNLTCHSAMGMHDGG
jgi:hypothetical protein